MVKGVLTTRIRSDPSTGLSWGSPSIVTSTAGSVEKMIVGGSVFRFSAALRRLSASSRLVSRRSMDITNSHLGITSSRMLARRCSCSGVASGNLTLVTSTSATVVVRVSRSVSKRADIQTVPNTGSVLPSGVTDAANLPVSVLSSKVSGCGW